LNTETVKAANAPEVRERLTAVGFDVVTSTPEAFARYIRSEVIKWRALAKQMALKPE
jgi:tripartite-type tricarboxylate transporter receptor subunit TctC